MKKLVIILVFLTLSSIFVFGHSITESHASFANVEQTSSQPILTAYQMLNKGVEEYYNENYSEAVIWFRKSAEQGYAPGQNWLGHMYEYGFGVPSDDIEAVKWYRKASDQGYPDAQKNLGQMYEYGGAVPKDYTEAVKLYRKAAEQGNAYAQFNLGRMYEYGFGVTKDLSEAKKWWQKAASQGNEEAKDKLKKLSPVESQNVEKGREAYNSKNYSEAVSWFRKAAEEGDADGQHWLGRMYYYGYGVPKDYSLSVKWCRQSAEQGNSEGQNSLGNMYYGGKGVPKDYSAAVKWYRKSAEQGHADGQINLGFMYENGYGVAKDYSEAVKWYRKAAEQGNSKGQNSLGYMYRHGYGVVQDYTEAVKWYRKSAEQGNALAQQNLGYMYDNGFGVPKNYSEAVKWYRKAAEQGYPIPQCSLGDMYYYGHGVEKDLSEAKKWWEKAAAQGFGPAKDNLKKIQVPEPTDGIPTLFWIECPAKTGNAQFALKVGINSSSTIKGYDVMLNGSATRGIKTVTNDGYDLMIDQPLTLAEGNNEIRVEATNASGRTVETRSVIYEKAVKPSPSPEQVQKRIALVVGNGGYSGAPLRNTLNDATAIASELRKLGFEVMFISDANKKKFDSAVNDFGLRARDYDVAMFYYAGHGIQYKGENFLVPVDATLSTQSDVEYECVNVNRILSKLEDSDVKMKIIALDACRNNPFERSWHRGAGSSRGLSAINVPIGTFISYATSPGTVAADGEGDHSPYTSAFLQTLKEKNLPIESVFKKVASIVVSTTGRSQLPWYTSSLFEGEFVFNPTHK